MLGDRFGRRPLVLITLYAQGILGVCLYFANSLEVFMGIRFVQGFFVQGLQGTSYALLVELFPPRLRTAVGVVLELYWALGLIILAGASYFVPNWRSRWLATRGQHREAQRVWDRILPHKKKQFSLEASVRKNLILNESSDIDNKVCSQNNTGDSDVKKHKTDDNILDIKGDSVNPDKGEGDSNNKIMSLIYEVENYSPNNEDSDQSESLQIHYSSNESDSGITDSSCSPSNYVLVNGFENFNNILIVAENGNEKVLPTNGDKIHTSSLNSDLDSNAIEKCSNKKTDKSAADKTQGTKEMQNIFSADEDMNEKSSQRIFTLSKKILDESNTDLINGTNEAGNNCSVESKMHANKPKNVDTKKTPGFLDLFRNGVLRKFSTSLSYYGIMFYLPDLSGERHLNFLLGAVLEALSYMFAYVILSRYGRRIPMTSYLFISGFICIIVGAGEYTLSAVPLIIMGVLDLLAGLLVLALPETLGQQLPDTVGEAEVLAKNKRHN
ncbi:hypothetical protein C0J52_07716 [Blattella germanica]|nr:hypothetical protein C0J52_07716 [Blattella germanica]